MSDGTKDPFNWQRPLPPEKVRGRDLEVTAVVTAAQAGQALTLAGPRRYGKTSMLNVVRSQLQQHGHPVVFADLADVASPHDLVVRLEKAWTAVGETWRQRAARIVAAKDISLSLSPTGPGISAAFAKRPESDPLPALHELLDLPVHVGRPDRRVVVILDEFQDVAAIPHAEGQMRSHFQWHGDHASYVFAGSEPHLLARQFEDPDRPFFGQATKLRLGRPPREALAATVIDEFERTERHPGDALDPMLATAEDHPQRAMWLAHHLWAITPPGEVAGLEEWDVALLRGREEVAGEVAGLFRNTSANVQRVLRIVAGHGSPHAERERAPVGLKKGSVTRSVELAVEGGLLEQLPVVPGGGGTKRYRVIDPMLADWLRRRFD